MFSQFGFHKAEYMNLSDTKNLLWLNWNKKKTRISKMKDNSELLIRVNDY